MLLVVLTIRTEAEESVSLLFPEARTRKQNRTTRVTIGRIGLLTGFSSHRYNTRSNKVRVVKTPGGKLRYLHIKKRGSPPKCGDCGVKLPGVSPRFFSRVSSWKFGLGLGGRRSYDWVWDGLELKTGVGRVEYGVGIWASIGYSKT